MTDPDTTGQIIHPRPGTTAVEKSRADGRDRTGDLIFTRDALYQLSYVGTVVPILTAGARTLVPRGPVRAAAGRDRASGADDTDLLGGKGAADPIDRLGGSVACPPKRAGAPSLRLVVERDAVGVCDGAVVVLDDARCGPSSAVPSGLQAAQSHAAVLRGGLAGVGER
jgi:hypothetical protein